MIVVTYYRPKAKVYDMRFFKNETEIEEWLERNRRRPYKEDIQIIKKDYQNHFTFEKFEL